MARKSQICGDCRLIIDTFAGFKTPELCVCVAAACNAVALGDTHTSIIVEHVSCEFVLFVFRFRIPVTAW